MSNRGRPRQFDREQALHIAMRMFRKHGFEGTSVSALAKEMGISMPSLYAAFLSKEELYREVVDLYIDTISVPAVSALLTSKQARKGIETFLKTCAEQFTTPSSGERGCMIATGDLACAPAQHALTEAMAMRRSAAEQAIRARLERARVEHELPGNIDVPTLARYFSIIVQGMSVHARDHASFNDLNKIAILAMKVWPEATVDRKK